MKWEYKYIVQSIAGYNQDRIKCAFRMINFLEFTNQSPTVINDTFMNDIFFFTFSSCRNVVVIVIIRNSKIFFQ